MNFNNNNSNNSQQLPNNNNNNNNNNSQQLPNNNNLSQQFSVLDLGAPLGSSMMDIDFHSVPNTEAMARVFREELHSFFRENTTIQVGGAEGTAQPQVLSSVTDFGNHMAMTRYIAEARQAELVARDIPRNPRAANRGGIPGQAGGYPSGSVRLANMLAELWRKKNGEGAVYPDEALIADRLQLRALARQIVSLMRNDGVVVRLWKDVSSLQKEYYGFRLEALAQQFGLQLNLCVESWAARLLLQEYFKGVRQGVTKRQARAARGAASRRAGGAESPASE